MRRRELVSTSSDFVDLGLPSGTQWCSHNIGTENPEETGLLFSWGNVVGHKDDGYQFNQSAYKLTDGYKLNTNIASENDAATVYLGNKYRMPNNTEVSELFSNTDRELATMNGVLGVKFMKKTDHSVFIFLGFNYSTNSGLYWTSSRYSSSYARTIYFTNNVNGSTSLGWSRYLGLPIRPVKKKCGLFIKYGSENTTYKSISKNINAGEQTIKFSFYYDEELVSPSNISVTYNSDAITSISNNGDYKSITFGINYDENSSRTANIQFTYNGDSAVASIVQAKDSVKSTVYTVTNIRNVTDSSRFGSMNGDFDVQWDADCWYIPDGYVGVTFVIYAYLDAVYDIDITSTTYGGKVTESGISNYNGAIGFESRVPLILYKRSQDTQSLGTLSDKYVMDYNTGYSLSAYAEFERADGKFGPIRGLPDNECNGFAGDFGSDIDWTWDFADAYGVDLKYKLHLLVTSHYSYDITFSLTNSKDEVLKSWSESGNLGEPPTS